MYFKEFVIAHYDYDRDDQPVYVAQPDKKILIRLDQITAVTQQNPGFIHIELGSNKRWDVAGNYDEIRNELIQLSQAFNGLE